MVPRRAFRAQARNTRCREILDPHPSPWCQPPPLERIPLPFVGKKSHQLHSFLIIVTGRRAILNIRDPFGGGTTRLEKALRNVSTVGRSFARLGWLRASQHIAVFRPLRLPHVPIGPTPGHDNLPTGAGAWSSRARFGYSSAEEFGLLDRRPWRGSQAHRRAARTWTPHFTARQPNALRQFRPSTQ